MGLFSNLERRPVTLFSSEDEGAPQLSPTAGSLKTILKACLVEGYGSKQPLGWEMLQETATDAIFKSKDPTACGAGIHVENTMRRMARIKGVYADNLEGRFWNYSGNCPYLGSGKTSGRWRIVGHSKCFALFVENTGTSSPYCCMYCFGDFPSLAPADTGNFMFYLGSQSVGNDNDGYLYSSQSRPWCVEDNSESWGKMCKSYDGLVRSVFFTTSSLFYGGRGVSYPDPITSGLMISEVYIRERVVSDSAPRPVRGLWPGLYVCVNDLSGRPLFNTFSGFDGTDDEYMLIFINDERYPFLINTTAWLA